MAIDWSFRVRVESGNIAILGMCARECALFLIR